MGEDLHRLEIEPPDRWVERAVDLLASAVAAAIDERDQCLLALSGGATPGPVLTALARRRLPWNRVVLLQADERLAPPGSADRNLTLQQEALGHLDAIWLPLPVDEVAAALDGPRPDPARVAAALDAFSRRLVDLADDPPVIDVAQLGLGADGHTASLLPGDPALDELRAYVALTGPAGGFRRLTLTRPVFDRARAVLWLVSGSTKSAPLGRLLAGDMGIPAGLLRPRQSVVLADADAARQV